MLSTITHAAHKLDVWLKQHVGRPYTLVLGIGLVLAIIETVGNLSKEISETGASKDLLGPVLTVLFQVALLINLAAQLHEHGTVYGRRKKAEPPQ